MEPSKLGKIRKYILKSCPYGETPDILADLHKISDFSQQDPEIEASLKEHFENHFTPIKAADGTVAVLATKDNVLEDGSYFDQAKKQSYKVNYYTATVASSAPYDSSNLTENLEKYKIAFDRLVAKYLDDSFRDKDSHFIVVGDSNQQKLFINYTAKNMSQKNFYSGEWISSWEVSPTSFSGHIRVYGHFFEDGNVQLALDKKFQENFDLAMEVDNETQHIMQIIVKSEGQLLAKVGELYENMTTQYFRAMRNILPITKEKINWEIFANKTVSSFKK